MGAVLEIGLTGGIGSGKSTVIKYLLRCGAVVIDADAIVRELQVPGTPVFDLMLERWCEQILSVDGSLNRQRIADLVFGNDEELLALNAMVHPSVAAEIDSRRAEFSVTDSTVILDVPLLVESGYKGFSGVIVVDLEPEKAVQRLVRYRGFHENDARLRMSRQVSRFERLAIADFVVDNSGSLTDLELEVGRCWSWITSLPRPTPGSTFSSIGS